MKASWYFFSFTLAVFTSLSSCNTAKYHRKTYTNTRVISQKVTQYGLSINYTFEKRTDGLHIILETDDPLMIKRIMALGLKVSLKKKSEKDFSLKYPLGYLERRSFRSHSSFFQFILATNNPEFWNSRLERMEKIALMFHGKKEEYCHIDSLNSYQLNFDLRKRKFYYQLILPNEFLEMEDLKIGITIYKLHILMNPVIRENSIIVTSGKNELSYLEYPWEFWQNM